MLHSRFLARSVFAAVLLAGASLVIAQPSPPELSFESGQTWLRGGAGMHVAWLGMVRTWDGTQTHIRYVRGSRQVPAGGLLLGADKDTSNSVWIVTGVPHPFKILQPSTGVRMSEEPLEVVATAGGNQIAIRAGVVHGVYVRPDGTSWAFAAGDGDVTDSDGASDGWIILSLSTLGDFGGNPAAPTTLRPADQILLIDPEESRAAAVRVAP